MKKLVLSLIIAFGITSFANAQPTAVTVNQIQFVSATDLANCTDLSSYDGQLIKTVGVVMHDGNLTELASGSVNGGYRPGVHILDTANNGAMGNFGGLQIHGVYTDGGGQSQPVSFLDNLTAGMIIEVVGTVGNFSGETQVFPSDNSSVTVLGTTTPPAPQVLDIGVLNDNTRTNDLTTGEQWEGSFVSFTNVTIVGVQIFSGNRISFDVADANGNLINVSDRFLVQKQASRTLVNPSSPQSVGTFVEPIVGTVYDTLSGIILHSENGCTGSSGRGYELNPFDTSHYKVGDTPPSITSVARNPLVPSSTDSATISATIVDFNGTVEEVKMYYTDNAAIDLDAFTELTMTLKSGSTDEFEAKIPNYPDGTLVRYYLVARDNDSGYSHAPFTANTPTGTPYYYTVRNGGLSIVDLQKTLDVTQDASPYLGETVTVTGIVTASAKPFDLEDVYIQDATATEWAGIRITGNSDLLDLWRTEEVEITGVVEESFGFTQINVSTITKTGNTATIDPVQLNVSDSAFYASREAEKYESMLVEMTASGGGKVFISNPRLNPFGEWTVADDQNANFNNSTKVQTGVKNSTNNSSLWVSVVSNDTLANDGGIMEVPAIEAVQGMSMDAIAGILYYGFGQYSLKPRNNDDLKGFSEMLDSTNYADTTASIVELKNLGIRFYPNPTSSTLNIVSEKGASGVLEIRSLNGQLIKSEQLIGRSTQVNVSELTTGAYILHFVGDSNTRSYARFLKL